MRLCHKYVCMYAPMNHDASQDGKGGGGVLDISLSGEVRPGHLNPDPV